MSSYYFLYTEIRLNGQWHCVNQYLPVPKRNTGEMEWKMIPTYESGSRSYFGNTFDKMREVGSGKPSDLSEELLEQWPSRKEDSVTYDYMTASISLIELGSCIPGGNHKQYCGIYHKNDIYAYETNERDDLYEASVDPKEYAKMAPEMREKLYQYYEWDDPMEWPRYFRILQERSLRLINEWLDAHSEWGAQYEARIICFQC